MRSTAPSSSPTAAILETADFPQIVAQAAGRDDALKLTESLPIPSAPVHIDDVSVLKREAELKEAVHDRFLDGNGEVAALTDLERELIAFALQHYGGRMSRVARALKIGRSTLYRKLREYGLDDEAKDDARATPPEDTGTLHGRHKAASQNRERLPRLRFVR